MTNKRKATTPPPNDRPSKQAKNPIEEEEEVCLGPAYPTTHHKHTQLSTREAEEPPEYANLWLGPRIMTPSGKLMRYYTMPERHGCWKCLEKDEAKTKQQELCLGPAHPTTHRKQAKLPTETDQSPKAPLLNGRGPWHEGRHILEGEEPPEYSNLWLTPFRVTMSGKRIGEYTLPEIHEYWKCLEKDEAETKRQEVCLGLAKRRNHNAALKMKREKEKRQGEPREKLKAKLVAKLDARLAEQKRKQDRPADEVVLDIRAWAGEKGDFLRPEDRAKLSTRPEMSPFLKLGLAPVEESEEDLS